MLDLGVRRRRRVVVSSPVVWWVVTKSAGGTVAFQQNATRVRVGWHSLKRYRSTRSGKATPGEAAYWRLVGENQIQGRTVSNAICLQACGEYHVPAFKPESPIGNGVAVCIFKPQRPQAQIHGKQVVSSRVLAELLTMREACLGYISAISKAVARNRRLTLPRRSNKLRRPPAAQSGEFQSMSLSVCARAAGSGAVAGCSSLLL